MSQIIENIERYAVKAKKLFEKYVWPTFRTEDYLSPQLEAIVDAQHPTVKNEFHFRLGQELRKFRNRRNFGLVFLIIGIMNGIIPMVGFVFFYWWYTKKQKMPTIPGKIYRKLEYKYALKPLVSQDTAKRMDTPTERRHDKPRKLQADKTYDPSNITLEFLRTGFIFDYDLKTYEVVAHQQYDWSNGRSESEFKCICNNGHIILTTRKEGTHIYIFVWSITSIYALDELLEKEINTEGKPRNIIHFEGNVFYRDTMKQGSAFDITNNTAVVDLKVWEFFNADGTKAIKIEKRNSDHFRVLIGSKESTYKFSEVLPK